MRGIAAILIIISSTLASSAAENEPTFPYAAKVSVDSVEVRCGPDWEYYPTQRLQQGAEVHVYRHETGGWLAIRPPDGAFSWVAARHVKLTADERIAEVAMDGVVAWVGTSVVRRDQLKWQVRLERGEMVEVLGQKSISVGPGFATETYYQIAPPAGEFRWIHAEDASSPESVAHHTASQDVESSVFRSRGRPTGDTSDITPSRIADRSMTGQEFDKLAERVRKTKMELSLLVTRDIEQWDLDALKQTVQELEVAAERTPLAREVRMIKHRVSECDLLQQRYEKMADSNFRDEDLDKRIERNGVSAAPRILKTSWQEDIESAIGPEQTIGTGVADGPAEGLQSLFDAEGWLMPVHSTKRVAPPFALLDDNGRVRCYVTPSPGLNLRRYAKKYVGLFGEKRFVDAFRTSHITATRVVKQHRTRE
jgi:hypothetical protein